MRLDHLLHITGLHLEAPGNEFWPQAVFMAALLCPWFVMVSLTASSSSRGRTAGRWLASLYLSCRLHADFHLWGPITGVVATSVGIARLMRGRNCSSPPGHGPRAGAAPDYSRSLLSWTAGGAAAVILARTLPHHLLARWLVCTWLMSAILDTGFAVRLRRAQPGPRSGHRPSVLRVLVSLPSAAGLALGLGVGGISIHRFMYLVATGAIGWIGLVFVVWRRRPRNGRTPLRLRGAYLACGTAAGLLATCLIMEAFFRYVYDNSDANAGLHTDRLWRARHVQLNTWGFRDREFEPLSRFDEHSRVLILGDSYAFGKGISNPGDMLGPQLQGALGDIAHADRKVAVFNVSRNGWSTRQELAAFEQLGRRVRPHLVVLVYMLNDIAEERGPRAARHPRLYRWEALRESSVFLDFFIWHLYIGLPRGRLDYVPPEVRRYADAEAFNTHTLCVTQLIDAVRDSGAAMLAVVYPYLAIRAGAGPQRQALDKMLALFRARDVPAIDVSRLVDTADWRYTVNRFDAHPNEELTRFVARAIAERIVKDDLLPTKPTDD